MDIKNTLHHISDGNTLDEDQAFAFVSELMNDNLTHAQIAAFFTSLKQRGETVDEIVGAARAVRSKASTIKAPDDAVDCCGTGGDGANTYNISTAVAFVAAACGVPMAKHGNRSATSQSGAADVLEALSISFDADHSYQF